MQEAEPLPFKPKDWVAVTGSHAQIGVVKDVYRSGSDILLDIVLYDLRGAKIGRESPACGGPRTFEPACDASGWERIDEPAFPVQIKWVDNGKGGKTARYHAGEALPPAAYVKKPRKVRVSAVDNVRLRRALLSIAEGHNDPRSLAKEALGL